MSLKSKAMMRFARRNPHFLLIPLVPIGLTISSFVMSLLTFRRVRQLSLPTI